MTSAPTKENRVLLERQPTLTRAAKVFALWLANEEALNRRAAESGTGRA